ncbi:P-loop ATPase [Paenibacillus oralis]|uniref:P-loop ATPase n=1 Tax=Paenibacillus oralis TaxID=2490856 RepID=A0A3P3U6T6_9BACL|nr:P-loop NTPase fold protein [Paenibacillus oralis]RRJ66077.1 P-loop ATPase [Paenibacillus oralis]
MMQNLKGHFYLLCKWLLFGFLLAEIILILKIIVVNFSNALIQNEEWLWFIGALYLVIIRNILHSKEVWKKIYIILKSKRWDLLLIFSFGAGSIILIDGLGIGYFNRWISAMSSKSIIILILLPIVFFMALMIRKLQVVTTKNINIDSFFISDKEGQHKDDDAFGFQDISKRFAERVYDQGSPESLVFGIDAPWGTGKSTFVNLCKEYWHNNYNDKMLVYTFDPLKYENSDKILEKFVEGLLKLIKNHFFAPELESLFEKYVKLMNDSKLTFSIFGMRFGMPFDNTSIDKTFEKLELVLRNMDKKIVVVVDDLDRLNFSSIKEVLFTIKKSFSLPNISYVLCYDTENITAFEQQKLDTEKIIEFLEKFINIKISLYLDQTLLLNYFTENKDKSVYRNLLSDPVLVSKAVEGLKDIFSSNEFYMYIPFIGDARKLKRLVNTIILLEVEKLDLSISDFDKHDLIHLLLIYINYPNIFRKIYNTEAQGKRGFFSVLNNYDDDYPKNNKNDSHNEDVYKNSKKYNAFLETLTQTQQFLLNKVFNAEQRLKKQQNLSQEQLTSYACFNGSKWSPSGRNLEQYLNLIIKISPPVLTEQYKYYADKKNEILNIKNISYIFNLEDFSFSSGEENHKQLWRVIINSSHGEFSPNKAMEVIHYALDSLPRYSILEIGEINVGLRHDLPLYIAKLLDKVGWIDESGNRFNNTDENVIQIAYWIFGENKHEHNGILDNLAKDERGILGLYDMLLFRLYCCADRGGDMYNLSRALSKHDGRENPTSGNVKDIVLGEMREISQYVFRLFNEKYISRGINIFEEILGLTAENVSGESLDYIKSQFSSEALSIKLFSLKSTMLSFMIYQLGSTTYRSGIPCGYYDFEGEKDGNGINRAMNEYLFDICFNPAINEINYNYFLYYLCINYQTTYEFVTKYVPHINEFTKVLNMERIGAYWEEHGENIKGVQFILKDKLMQSYSKINYETYLEEAYKLLDKLVSSNNSQENETRP